MKRKSILDLVPGLGARYKPGCLKRQNLKKQSEPNGWEHFNPNHQYGKYIEIENTTEILEMFNYLNMFIPKIYMPQVKITVKLPFIYWKYTPVNWNCNA